MTTMRQTSVFTKTFRNRFFGQPYVGHSSLSSLHFSTSRPTIKNICNGGSSLQIDWSDGERSKYPLIYLRDNCTDGKTRNGQRLFETYQLQNDQVTLNEFELGSNGNSVNVVWKDDLRNEFSSQWLYENSCNPTHRQQREKQMRSNVTMWDGRTLTDLPIVCNYNEMEARLYDIYATLRRYGVLLIKNVPRPTFEEIEEQNVPVVKAANTLGFVRWTNYGKYFDVRSVAKETSNHLAYTSAGLSVHTDNPYRRPTPGIQLLHCVSQAVPQTDEKNEGKTVLIDGFNVAEEIRRTDPKAFELLSTIRRPFTYLDVANGYILSQEKYAIEVDSNGQIENIHFNNRSAATTNWDIDEDLIEPYYAAWQLFGKLLADDSKYAIQYRLEAGDLIVFNNNRVLHGRKQYVDDYDNVDESRLLQGCYIDHDTVWGRLAAYESLHGHHEFASLQAEKKHKTKSQ